MNNESINTFTRLTANAHEGQPAADTNNTRIIRYESEVKQVIAELLARHSDNTDREQSRQFPKPPVCAYSRKQALADGLEVQVLPEFLEKISDIWDLSMCDCPTFLTKKAVEACETVSGRNLYAELGPLWAILCVLEAALDCPFIGYGSPMIVRIPFEVGFGSGGGDPHVCLNVAWSTLDVHDQQPSFTIMLPEEY